MNGALTGRYETTAVGGERVRAFVPDPLPPARPLMLGGAIQRRLERANVALGRLDGVSSLPSATLARYRRR